MVKILVLLIIMNIVTFAEDGMGSIKWTEKGPIVIAKGIGAMNPQMPLAVQRPAVIEAAKIDGLRKALEMIKGVNINSETTVENQMLSNDIIIKNSSGVIKTYSVGKPHYYSDGTVVIEITVPLYQNKELIEMLLPKNKIGTDVPKTEKTDKPFTGIIINCIDLGIMPALTFNVADEKTKNLYSPKMVSKDALFTMEGMAGYVMNKKQALEGTERIGKNPLIIDAIRASGKYKTDVVVSEKDGEKIGELNNLLKECRVIIISNSY